MIRDIFDIAKKSDIDSLEFSQTLNESMQFNNWSVNCTGGGGYGLATTIGCFLRLAEIGLLDPKKIKDGDKMKHISYLSGVSGSSCAVMIYHICISDYFSDPCKYEHMSPRDWYMNTVLKLAMVMAKHKIFLHNLDSQKYIENVEKEITFDLKRDTVKNIQFSYFSMNLTWELPKTHHHDMPPSFEGSLRILNRCMLPLCLSDDNLYTDYGIFGDTGEPHCIHIINNFFIKALH